MDGGRFKQLSPPHRVVVRESGRCRSRNSLFVVAAGLGVGCLLGVRGSAAGTPWGEGSVHLQPCLPSLDSLPWHLAQGFTVCPEPPLLPDSIARYPPDCSVCPAHTPSRHPYVPLLGFREIFYIPDLSLPPQKQEESARRSLSCLVSGVEWHRGAPHSGQATRPHLWPVPGAWGRAPHSAPR